MKFMLFAVFLTLGVVSSMTAYRFAKVKFIQFDQMEKQAFMLTDKVSQLSHINRSYSGPKDHFDHLTWMTLSMGLDRMSTLQIQRLRNWT